MTINGSYVLYGLAFQQVDYSVFRSKQCIVFSNFWKVTMVN